MEIKKRKVGRPRGINFEKELGIRIKNEDYEKLKTVCEATGLNMSYTIRMLIADYIHKFEAGRF